MVKLVDVKVPDIGNASDVDVIEINVAVGDRVDIDTSLVTLESDKASMDIPSPYAGVVKEINIKVGDKVSKDSLILRLETEEVIENKSSSPQQETPEVSSQPEKSVEAPAPEETPTDTLPQQIDVCVPDIGNAKEVDVIEVNVAVGDHVDVDSSLVTLESDKASMDIPSPYAGVVKEINVTVGDKVSKDSLILRLESSVAPKKKSASPVAPELVKAAPAESKPVSSPSVVDVKASGGVAHAGPAVRRFARELGVDLTKVTGTGPKDRILKEDIQRFVKAALQGESGKTGTGTGLPFNLPPLSPVDFSQFGEIETVPLSRIKRLSGSNLHRNWLQIPHVTQFDEADITELEEFRKAEQAAADKHNVKLTPLVFIMKAVVGALKIHPNFNASLDPSGEKLVLKKYFHLGIAVDTPNGLMVPVIRDVDRKGVFELAKELAEVSERARTKGLMPADMQGSSFTISSLGGIGGTAFTPIVNLPDVAILGVSRSQIKPVYKEGQFVPRLMLPLSLSYDHRVIDGAQGARFSRELVTLLSDLRNLLL